MKRQWLIAAVTAAAVVGSAPAWSQGGAGTGWGPGYGYGMTGPGMMGPGRMGFGTGPWGWGTGEFDGQAARKAYDAMAQAHKQMFESSLAARKRIESVLTEEQKKQLKGAR